MSADSWTLCNTIAETPKGKESHHQMMEIRSPFSSTVVKNEVTSPVLGSPQNPEMPAQHNLMQQLQQQHEFQHEFLLRQYQQQQQQLSAVHEKQLQLQIKPPTSIPMACPTAAFDMSQYLEAQHHKLEEDRLQKIRLEQDRIEAIKKKDKHEHSAVASSEVKQRLQEMLLKKQQNTMQGGACAGPSNMRNWPPGHILSSAEDFPLRKTASEPNICLRYRLKKQRLMERDRRTSPLVSRKDRIPGVSRRRQLTHVDSASTPDSGQDSPPNGIPTSRSSSGSTPIHEEGGGSPYGMVGQCEPGSELSHSFTSLPNISLGRPPHSSQEGTKLPMVSETEMVTAAKAGMPITGHILPSTLPNYPTLPVLESDMRHTAMDTSSPAAPVGTYPSGQPLTEAQQARLRTLQRPLGRTQSSPLPLGHPMLQGPSPSTAFIPNPHGIPNAAHHHPHNIVKQHIRQAVLKRSSSKSHVENVEEETEADVAQAIGKDKMPEEDLIQTIPEPDAEVIDLTATGSHAMEPSSLYGYKNSAAYRLEHNRRTGMGPRSGSHAARPLKRAQSSPSVTLSPGSPQESYINHRQNATTGIAYESLMQKHQCMCGITDLHPEHSGRISAIWNRLQETGMARRCYRVRPRKAEIDEIKCCHSESHTLFFGSNYMERQIVDFDKLGGIPIRNFVRLSCGGLGIDSDTTWSETHTSSAARMAVGCFLELAFKVATGDLQNGYAIVRPPGHHAEYSQAMGFCFFNTVAITARQVIEKAHMDKILIIDWDVHHGNGTQSIFYEDSHVLYISLHRYDDGSFFPGTGAVTEVGENDGYGFNVNIAWCGGLSPPMGDAEYLAAFRSIVMPIAKDFNPDMVMVSCGFDAADGHPSPLGGYKVSPSCFGHMTKELMCLARGKVILALEGGYNETSICDSSQAVLAALLNEELPPISDQEMSRRPCLNAIETMQHVLAVQTPHWPVIRRNSGLIGLSANEVLGREDDQDTVSAMASLRVDHHQGSHNASPEPVLDNLHNCVGHDEVEPMEEDIDNK